MPRKKKVKVENENDAGESGGFTIKAPPKPPPAWLSNCPLQDEDPFFEARAKPSLAPGPALEQCSGSDIHYQKASSKRPKYLAFLPGLLALHQQQRQQQQQAKTPSAPENSKATIEEENDSKPAAMASMTQDTVDLTQDTVEFLTQETNTEETTAAAAAPTQSTSAGRKATESSSSNNTLKMGQITGLHTEDDTALTLPLDDHRQLKFQGHKVSTSSKFVVLTIQPKKGRVVCRGVFSSAIVFGNPQEVVTQNGATSQVAVAEAKKGCLEISSSFEEEEEEEDERTGKEATKESEEESTLEHYGGSCRAWDGSMQGRVSNKFIPAAASTRKMKPPPPANDHVDLESEEEAVPDDKGDDSDEFQMDISNPVATKRTAPRRQSRKKVQYIDMDESESGDEESSRSLSGEKPKPNGSEKGNEEIEISSEGSEVEKAPLKPPPKRTQKLSTGHKPVKKVPMNESEEDESSDDEIIIPPSFNKSLRGDDSDDEDFEMDTKNAASLTRRASSRRSSSRKRTSPPKSYLEKHEDSEGSESESSEGGVGKSTDKKNAKKSQRQKDSKKNGIKNTTASRRSSVSRKWSALLDTDSDDESLEHESDSDEEKREAQSQRKSTANSQGRSATKGAGVRTPYLKKSSTKHAPADADSDSGDSENEDESKKGSGKKSTPRRRRRRAPNSARKESNVQTPMNLSDSDGSIAIVVDAPPPKRAKKNARTASDDDSDASYQPTAPKRKQTVPSTQKKDRSSRKTKSQSENLRWDEGDAENSNQTNQSSDDELGSNATKLMFAKAISRGKAARPSPAKTEQEKSSGTPSSATGTPPRRRRAKGKSPRSPAKLKTGNLADDGEYSFLG